MLSTLNNLRNCTWSWKMTPYYYGFLMKICVQMKNLLLACLKKKSVTIRTSEMPGKPAHLALFLVSSGKKDNKERDSTAFGWNLKSQAHPTDFMGPSC